MARAFRTARRSSLEESSRRSRLLSGRVLSWRTMIDEPEGVLEAALAAVRRAANVAYADARVVDLESESIRLTMEDGEGLARESSRGVAVRVIADGAWGFAATTDVSEEAA